MVFREQLIYSLIAQSVERMTVNHDVVGSSPTRGAKVKYTFTLFLSIDIVIPAPWSSG